MRIDLKSKHYVALGAAFLLMVLAPFQNCAKQRFSTTAETSTGVPRGVGEQSVPDATTDTGAPSCRTVFENLTVPVRVLFMVDVSGSNAPSNSNPGTDPDKAVRNGAIERFHLTYQSKANLNWSFGTFASNKVTQLARLGNSSAMADAIATFDQMTDAGNTPYAIALSELKDLILADGGRTPTTLYIVVFLSDGQPNPNISNSDLTNAVQQVVATVPGKVSFNTIYYGPNDTEASGRLKRMAADGGGNFLDTNANGTGNVFKISDLIQVPGQICNQ